MPKNAASHPFPWRWWLPGELLLALGAGVSVYVSDGPAEAASAFFCVFLAALPLPYLSAAFLPVFCLRRDLEQQGLRLGDRRLRKAASLFRCLAEADTVLFSRRDTITAGPTYLTEIVPEGLSQPMLLGLAASAERGAQHPFGKIICRTAAERQCRLQRVSAVHERPGVGAEALSFGRPLRVGSLPWLQQEGAEISAELLTRADQLSCHGRSVVGVSTGSHVRGLIAFAQELSPEAEPAFQALHRLHLHTVLFTHGNAKFANAFKKILRLSRTEELGSPAGMIRSLLLYAARGHVILSLSGPGQLQDLAASVDARICLSSDTTSEKDANTASADLTLPALTALAPLLTLSRKLEQLCRCNVRLSLAGFALLLALAFGALEPFGIARLSLPGAVIGQLLLLLVIVLSTLRGQPAAETLSIHSNAAPEKKESAAAPPSAGRP